MWDDKPDKNDRSTLCEDYTLASLRMIKIKRFITMLKVSWISRPIKQNDAEWVSYFSTLKIYRFTPYLETTSVLEKCFKFMDKSRAVY